jgi:hypothetical protein
MIRLNHEAADAIAVEVLKEDYINVKQNIRNIKPQLYDPKTPDYVGADYAYDKKLLKALKRVLHYHMVHEDYRAFIKENK